MHEWFEVGGAQLHPMVSTDRCRVTTAIVDVADRIAVEAWADAAAADHGRVNLVINNGGATLTTLAEVVGHSNHWVRQRLNEDVAPAQDGQRTG